MDAPMEEYRKFTNNKDEILGTLEKSLSTGIYELFYHCTEKTVGKKEI